MTAELATETSELVAIRLPALYPPATIDADLYQWSGGETDKPRLYSLASNPPTARDLDALARRGIVQLYLSSDDVQAFRNQIRSLLDAGADLPPAVHLEMAREAVKDHLARAWQGKSVDPVVSHAAEFAETMTSLCRPGIDTNAILMSLLTHDGDTFAHVSNVCTYTIMLARAQGIADNEQLAALGQAALLHDLGKRRIQSDILKKPGALTSDERSVIYEHPRLGFEELCDRPEWTRDQLLMVYHHHEKLDGTGYPVGLCGDEIGWTARLCAVVDVFDALTGRRAYRQSSPAEEALAMLERGAGTHFDAELVRCWSLLVRKNCSPIS